MKTGIRALTSITVAFALSTVCIPEAHAYITLNGMVPVGRAGIVILSSHKQTGTTDTLKFKFSAPSFSVGVSYTLSFCIGPAANPCGDPNSYSVQVPVGEERLAVVPSSVFANNVLVVGTGTSRPVPYSVTME